MKRDKNDWRNENLDEIMNLHKNAQFNETKTTTTIAKEQKKQNQR